MMPNFLYSMALAYFFSSQKVNSLGSSSGNSSKAPKTDYNTEECLIFAEESLEKALTRFPFVLGYILDKLQIQPDSQVNNCYALSTLAYHK